MQRDLKNRHCRKTPEPDELRKKRSKRTKTLNGRAKVQALILPLAPSWDDIWKEASSPQPSPPEEEREHRRERLGRVVAQTPGQWGSARAAGTGAASGLGTGRFRPSQRATPAIVKFAVAATARVERKPRISTRSSAEIKVPLRAPSTLAR